MFGLLAAVQDEGVSGKHEVSEKNGSKENIFNLRKKLMARTGLVAM
jgi:hypothetical protein